MGDLNRALEAAAIAACGCLRARGLVAATAESCTGGMIAARLTDLAGSSAWFDRGCVTYSNAAKTELLGVAPGLISAHGAVSREVAEAMARGLLDRADVQVVVAATGIAGPGGAVAGKPVGTVWLAWGLRLGVAAPVEIVSRLHRFDGDRAAVRAAAATTALRGICNLVDGSPSAD